MTLFSWCIDNLSLVIYDVFVICSYTIAAEEKARTTYEHLMNLTDCEQYLAPLRFLREREIVHYQRFGECLNILLEMYPDRDQNKLCRK